MKGHRWNRWTREEDILIVHLRGKRQSHGSIAQSLGKIGGAVYHRFKNLTAMRRVDNAVRDEGSPLAEPSSVANRCHTDHVSLLHEGGESNGTPTPTH